MFKFLYYRIAAASLLLIVLFFNTKSPYKFSPNTLVILSAIIASTAVEFLIVNFKGHQSTYYAGMIITIIFILGFMPISFGISLIVVSIVLVNYIFPILFFEQITNPQLFISNNIFLISISTIALAWRFLSQRSLISKLELEYELDLKSRQLEQYSNRLEDMVVERTKEIGIMKAIGATNKDIAMIFLFESGILGLLGSLLSKGVLVSCYAGDRRDAPFGRCVYSFFGTY